MSDEKPDRFGPYADTIQKVHNGVRAFLCQSKKLEKEKMEMPIHQMSIFEYIEAKHDDNYVFFKYTINNIEIPFGSMPPVFIAINRKYLNSLFSDEYFKVEIPEILIKLWKKSELKCIDFYAKEEVLTCTINDTIQSVHFFYKSEQLFKIIYGYSAFKHIL